MKIESGKIEGNLVVDEPFELQGMVTGVTTVTANGSLKLQGMCCDDLVIQKGGVAMIMGTVDGNLVNEGTVELRGVIRGNVHSRSGHFQRSPSSVVRGTVET